MLPHRCLHCACDLLSRTGYKGANICGDVMEALIGAVFLDRGWAAALRFTAHLVENVLGLWPATINSNFKGILLEQCQLLDLSSPRFAARQSIKV